MNSHFRRSALFALTPAALLAACSSSDSWHSSRAETDSRADYAYNGKTRSDGYSSADRSSADRTYTAANGRRYYYSNDPYGDGVSGGVGTRAAIMKDGTEVAYSTRTSDRNNPNWRDGPTRFDNDNPSQDNSSSQYNTGVTRNQSPGDGAVNNQNIAKGTVRPEGQYQGQYRDQAGVTHIDDADARWQNDDRNALLDKAQRDRERSAQLNRQDQANGQLDNQNPSKDNSSSQYNTGIARNSSPNEGTVNNQNMAKGTAGYRTADGRWVSAPQANNQGWYSRDEAARRSSDASTNPSNSNVQQGQQNWSSDQQQNWASRNQNWNQNNQQLPPREQVRDQNGNWIERNFNTTNMTTPDQQAAARQISDPQSNPTNSNAQFNQPGGVQYANAQNSQDYTQRTYPVESSPNNGVAPLGPQNNWGANRARTPNTTYSSNDPASRNTMWTETSKQAAAREISDPATNPTNSNAQIGQQNVAGLNQSNQVDNKAYSSRPADMNAAGQSQVYASSATADQKILSLLHFKNQKEIELGRLAATNGSSEAVKDYGNMLVREHTSADAKVMAVASRTGTSLMSDTETQNMMRAEKAAKDDSNREKMADDSQVMKDPVEELRGLNGADFDRAFAQKMVKGHEKLAAAIEKAKPQVRNEQTRQLLNELLPTVRHHEQMARELPGYTETASAR
ncbi:MAG: DUF4142 domain-containing protein [Phycisphaerales bacterium]